MGKCKMVSFLQNGIKQTFTCDYVRENLESMKLDFRKANRSDEMIQRYGSDRVYDSYCKEIQEFLDQCKCNDISLKCSNCLESDHEGHFCRCESRNIQLARQLREQGISPWSNATQKKSS